MKHFGKRFYLKYTNANLKYTNTYLKYTNTNLKYANTNIKCSNIRLKCTYDIQDTIKNVSKVNLRDPLGGYLSSPGCKNSSPWKL